MVKAADTENSLKKTVASIDHKGFSLSGKQMGRSKNQLSDGQHCVCRLLSTSSKKETLVASWCFLHAQALGLISEVRICHTPSQAFCWSRRRSSSTY